MTKRRSHQEIEAELNARAWKDPAFKNKLLRDPKAALKEIGVESISPSVTVRLVEEKEQEWTIVLRPAPKHSDQLSEAELRSLAAGMVTNGGAGPLW